MNAMQHKFTLREKILLLVLVAVLIVGLYFLCVFYPLRNKRAEIRAQQDEVQLKNDVADIRLTLYQRMQDAIAEIEKVPEAERTRMYKYSEDEVRDIRDFVLGCMPNRQGTLGSPQVSDLEDGKVKSVAIPFSFNISADEDPETAYEKTKKIISDMMNSGRRSQMGNLTVTANGGDLSTGSLAVNGTITFYELA